MHGIYKLKNRVCQELEDFGLNNSNWDVNDLDVIDKLTHILKNLIEIIKYSDSDCECGCGFNHTDPDHTDYTHDYSSMSTADELRELMNNVADESLKQDFVRLINKIEGR